MLSTFVQALMSPEADAICGAPYRERSPERTNSRNDSRTRGFDTRTGTMEVAIPKLREGSCFPDWLRERRRRAERALTTVAVHGGAPNATTTGTRTLPGDQQRDAAA